MVFVSCSANVSFICLCKLKVSLAAQTLSNSVAVALRTLQDLDYAEFRDSEATSEFIKVMQVFASLWLLNVNVSRIIAFHILNQELLTNYDPFQFQQYARTWLKQFIPTSYFPQKHLYCHIKATEEMETMPHTLVFNI